jgi:hypothetical protein
MHLHKGPTGGKDHGHQFAPCRIHRSQVRCELEARDGDPIAPVDPIASTAARAGAVGAEVDWGRGRQGARGARSTSRNHGVLNLGRKNPGCVQHGRSTGCTTRRMQTQVRQDIPWTDHPSEVEGGGGNGRGKGER